MTDGFDVLVQLVIAAMATAPCPIPVASMGACGAWPDSPSVLAPAAGEAAPFAAPVVSARAGAGGSRDGNAASNDDFACDSGMRSWGRRGPAMLGSTVLRSSSSVSLNTGSGLDALWNNPCSFM